MNGMTGRAFALSWACLGMLSAATWAAESAAPTAPPPVVLDAYQVSTTPLSDIEFDLRMREARATTPSADPGTGLRGTPPPPPTIAAAYVRVVRPNSRAGQAGIKVGDQILRVQGKPLAGLTDTQFKALFLLPFGDTYTLTIKRSAHSKPEEIAIPLRLKKPASPQTNGAPPPADGTEP
jgi:hypothetical protein